MDRDQETEKPAGWGGLGGISPAALVASALLAASVAWSYFPSFKYLAVYWDDPNYSHGWLIVPIAVFMLWHRRKDLAFVSVRHRWWQFLPLLALLAIRPLLFERNEQWAEAASVPLVVAATVLAVGGWGLLKWSWPGLVFLFFMLPLPDSLNDKLAYPLQRFATLGSVEVLQSLRQPALAEGNVILIGTQRVEVAEACRGLSMLLSFGALITAMVILVRRPLGERIALVVSIIPIALACNIIRIAVTAIAYAKYDRPVKWVHDYAGFGMMAMALAFVLIELKVMSWLVVEVRDAGPRSPFPGALAARKAGPP